MNKDEMFNTINSTFEELKAALEGDDLAKIKELTLELHALVHPAEISGRAEKTVADIVFDHMLAGNQNEIVQRETWDADLHYAGSKTVPMCWQLQLLPHLHSFEYLYFPKISCARRQIGT